MSGGKISLAADGIKTVTVTEAKNGSNVNYRYKSGEITFKTEKDSVYEIKGFSKVDTVKQVKNLTAAFKTDGVKLKWRKTNEKYAVYRAIENDKGYKLLGVTDNSSFVDKDFSLKNKARLTYKIVTAVGEYSQKSQGQVVFLNPATKLEEERYAKRLKVNNIYANEWKLR